MMEKKAKPKMFMPAPSGGGDGEADESSVRWLISYSDFMMQLVCLFILLYSVSSIDMDKLAVFLKSWRHEVGLQPVLVPVKDLLSDEPPLTQEDLPEVVREVEVMVGRYPEGRNIRVTPEAEGIRLQLLYSMFDEGSGRLNSVGERVLDMAVRILKPYERRAGLIEIVGHTAANDRETESGSALRLSLTRSREAYKRMTRPDAEVRLDAAKLEAAGRGPSDPVEDNRDPRTQALNRRVDFFIRFPARKGG